MSPRTATVDEQLTVLAATEAEARDVLVRCLLHIDSIQVQRDALLDQKNDGKR